MHPARSLARPATALLSVVLAALTLTACGGGPSDTATVVKVVDGDTVDVERDGTEVRVRLLNVDAPESVDPDEPVECLGEDAADVLRELLPVGTEVRLETDVELHDRYDRLLAGVFTGDLLVNAEVARRGMGHAVVVEPNEKFYPPVHEAEQAARAAGAGLHDVEVDCTLPGQVAALEDDTEQTVAAAAGLAAGIGLEEVDRHRTRLATAATTGGALLALLDGARTSGPTSRYDDDVLVDLRERTARQHERVSAAQVTTDALRATEEQRVQAERIAAEEEARRVAQEAVRQADEARRAEEAREADAARQAARAASAASQPASGGSGGSATSGGSGGSGGGSVSYQNCDAVRAAGAAPLLVGQPGYARKLDRDGDGVACE